MTARPIILRSSLDNGFPERAVIRKPWYNGLERWCLNAGFPREKRADKQVGAIPEMKAFFWIRIQTDPY